jgi:hypothetical protein
MPASTGVKSGLGLRRTASNILFRQKENHLQLEPPCKSSPYALPHCAGSLLLPEPNQLTFRERTPSPQRSRHIPIIVNTSSEPRTPGSLEPSICFSSSTSLFECYRDPRPQLSFVGPITLVDIAGTFSVPTRCLDDLISSDITSKPNCAERQRYVDLTRSSSPVPSLSTSSFHTAEDPDSEDVRTSVATMAQPPFRTNTLDHLLASPTPSHLTSRRLECSTLSVKQPIWRAKTRRL